MSDYRADDERLDRHLEPAVSAVKTGGHGKFVAAVLVACFALLTSVLALNLLVDPFALAGTGLLPAAVETDRSIKLNLIEELPRNPEILIMGSSRARQAEPAFLKRLTGHTGFNAAVTGGTAADAWVMTRYAADRFPHARRRYLWFVESGIATNGINPQLSEDPRASRYLAGKSVQFGLHQVGEYISLQATRASLRVIKACVVGTCKTRVRYLADGSIAAPTLKYLPEHARSLRRSVAKLVANIKSRPPRHPNVNPARYEFFERALAFMNKHGARPVIVLNPIHPEVLAALRRRGFPAHKTSLAYLHALHRRFDFVVVDCQDIRRWGGSSQDFADSTHVNLRNMRRMLRYIVAHSEGALN